MKKISIFAVALVALAGSAFAVNPCQILPPGDPDLASSGGVQPIAVQAYADAYDFGVGPAHFLIGTADPNGASCLPASNDCDPGDTQIARAAYVGSLCIGCPGPPNANQMVSVMAFPADEIGNAKDCSLRVSNLQNFQGYAHNLTARVLRNRGDNGSDFGAEDIFRDIGPFGVPTGGSAGAIVSLVTEARATPDGECSIPSGGDLLLHPFGPGPLDSYETFDRTVEIALGDLRDEVAAAQDSGASYTTCRSSCLGAALNRNADCDLGVSNALYIAFTSTVAGNRSSSAAIQDGITSDNILHLTGDCDFDGGDFPGDVARVELLCN